MARINWRNNLLAATFSLLLAACDFGNGSKAVSSNDTPNAPTSPAQSTPNVVPTLTGTPATTVTAGTTYLFQPQAADADGDALTFSATGLPGWASINSQTGALAGTPTESDVGTTAEVILSVSDGEASISLPAFRIAITSAVAPPVTPPPATNRAPLISGTPATSVTATQAFSFTPTASDPDGQTLTFSVSNLPAWATFSTTTGRVSGTPSATQVRTYSNIVITVSDGTLSASLPAFFVTVNASANRAPTISGSASTSVSAGTAYSFRPTGSDPDGQTLTYSILNKPSWASFSSNSGRLSGTPTSSNLGTTSGIVITVSDGALTASLAAFSITVSATSNTAPVISGTPATNVSAGSIYSFAPVASDADGNTLAFSIVGKPSWATFSTSSGSLTGTPGNAQVGSYSGIVISASDGSTSTSLPAFTITVTAPATGAATLSWSVPTLNTDGSSLTDLAGFRVYHGTSANSLTDVADVPGASASGYTWTQLASGTHYFAVAAYSSSEGESAMSSIGSKTIP
jgi:hypothetical protein